MFASICKWLATDTNGIILTLFVCLALGYAIGKVRIGIISLGATVGTLLVAVIISVAVSSVAPYEISSVFRSMFFDLFIFALGFDVGPTFVQSLKTSGVKLVIQALFFALAEFAIGAACYFIFRLGVGELAGLYAGAVTQSTILGAAQSMMSSLGITGAAASDMNGQMTAAFAVGYLISYAGCVILIKSFLPLLLGCKNIAALKDEVKSSVQKMNYKGSSSSGSLFDDIRLRTYKVLPDAKDAPKTVGAFQEKFQQHMQIETLMRADASGNYSAKVDFDKTTPIEPGDVIALIGNLEYLQDLEAEGLDEVTDRQFQKAMIYKDQMVVTKPISEEYLARMYDFHVMPVSATRGGSQLTDLSSFKHGDIVTIMGTKNCVQKVIKQFGYPVDSSEDSDVIYMGIGVIIGILIGIITINVAGIPLSFGAGGGIMFLGIFCGWYNDKHPQTGHVSPGARWLMKSIGLNVFVACLGLSSGATFLSSLKSMGINMIIALIIMAFLPHILSVLFARYVLKLDIVEALGGTCGSGTNTAALNGLIDETDSSIFATAYTPAYAMANIILTFIGTFAIAIFH